MDSRSLWSPVPASRALARLASIACLQLGLLSWSQTVDAAPSEAARRQAGSAMEAGDSSFEKRDFAAALESYRKADELVGVPSTRVAVARALMRLGRWGEAREAAHQVIGMPVEAKEPAPFTRARAEAARMVADLDVRMPSLLVEIEGLPSGVSPSFKLDGKDWDGSASGQIRRVDPGWHELVATADGFVAAREGFESVPGQSHKVVLRFTPRAQGKTEARSEGGTSSTLTYVGFGLAGVGFLAGSVTGYLTLAKASDVKDRCNGNVCPTDVESDADSARSMGTISTVSFAVGGVGLGLGFLGLLLSDGQGKESKSAAPARRIQWTPVLGTHHAGLVGRF